MPIIRSAVEEVMLDPLTNLVEFVQSATTLKKGPKLGLRTTVIRVLRDYGIEHPTQLVKLKAQEMYRYIRIFYSRYKHLLNPDQSSEESKQLASKCDESLNSKYKSAHAAYHDPRYYEKTMGQCASYHFHKNDLQCDKKIDPKSMIPENKITPRSHGAYRYRCEYDERGRCKMHANCNTKWLC